MSKRSSRASGTNDYSTMLQEVRRLTHPKLYIPSCELTTNTDLLKKAGPIYKILYDKLISAGCCISARFFDVLVNKELELSQSDLKFKKRVRDSSCLLMAIVENVKGAELTYYETQDRLLVVKMLVQTVHMIQAQDDAYRWLVIELYKIILEIAEPWEEDCTEVLSRTRYEYAYVLVEKGDDKLDEAIAQMSKSLEKCKSTMWYTNDFDRSILHEDVCTKLCETLLRKARLIYKEKPAESCKLVKRAVDIITEIGVSINKNLYCKTNIRLAEYLLADGRCHDAFTVLSDLQNHILGYDSPRNKCEFYLWLGICHFKLHMHSSSMRKFKLSLFLSDKYNFIDLKADALLFVGKIHARDATAQSQARTCFIEAKELFFRLRDFENEKLARFLMAKLRAYQIFPSYISLIKKASTKHFCYLFDLVQWKQKMLPFWNAEKDLNAWQDNVQCLLQEQVGKELTIIPN